MKIDELIVEIASLDDIAIMKNPTFRYIFRMLSEISEDFQSQENKIEKLEKKVDFLMRLTRYHQDMPGYSEVLEELEEEYESLQNNLK